MTEQRGRPAVLASDRTDYDVDRVDVDARVGWLLRVNRLCSPDPEDRSLSRFADRLRSSGIMCDGTRISRWETGSLAAPAAVIHRYERLLGLAAGAMVAVVAGLRSSLGRRSAVRYDEPGGQGLSEQERLDAAYGRVAAPEPSGGDWIELADLLTDSRRVLLPSVLVEDLAARLLSEQMRAVGVAYTTRCQALTRLVAHPPLTVVVADAIETAAREPGAQGVVDPVSLLGETSQPHTVAKLLTLLTRETGAIQVGAAHAVLNLVVTGTFPAAARPRLREALRYLTAADPRGTGRHLAELIGARLPGPDRLPAGPPGSQPAPTGPRAETAVRRQLELETYVTAAREATGIEFDPMLDRLLAEALGSRYVERRHHAALLLMTSPYRTAIARAASRSVVHARRPAARQSAAYLLSYVVGADEVPLLRGWLGSDRPDLRRVALGTLAHTRGDAAPLDLAALAERPDVRAPALAYTAGMTGHPVLHRWHDEPATPWVLRRSARWWLRHGAAVHEPR